MFRLPAVGRRTLFAWAAREVAVNVTSSRNTVVWGWLSVVTNGEGPVVVSVVRRYKQMYGGVGHVGH